LKNLESRRTERDRIRAELNKIENKIVSALAEQKSCGENLKKVAEARENIQKIQPQVVEQESLEKRLDNLKTDLAEAKTAENQIASLKRKLSRLRGELGDINNKIKAAEQKSASGENFENLQKRDSGNRARIARTARRSWSATNKFKRKSSRIYLKINSARFCRRRV
jgi:predicted  nucleic acid-binding Zn-ribbon protein